MLHLLYHAATLQELLHSASWFSYQCLISLLHYMIKLYLQQALHQGMLTAFPKQQMLLGIACTLQGS